MQKQLFELSFCDVACWCHLFRCFPRPRFSWFPGGVTPVCFYLHHSGLGQACLNGSFEGLWEVSLGKRAFFKVVCYVDDYLLFFNRTNQQDEKLALANARSIFQEKVEKLVFTTEVPSGGQLQFLNLSLFIQEHHVC